MTEQADRKKVRHRSPAYPSIDLRTAIEKAAAIYKEEKRATAPVGVIAEHCGYDISSSSGLRVVAALKQFGLLLEAGNNEDRELRLSELALDILLAESDDSPERRRAVKTAALAPPIHRKIWDKFGGNLPSKQTLRAFLIRELEFNDGHVDNFIRKLFETVNFARLDEPVMLSDIEEEEEEEEESSGSSSAGGMISGPFASTLPVIGQFGTIVPQRMQVTVAGLPSETVRLPVSLPSLRVAWLEVPRNLSVMDFDTLINSLTMFKDALIAPPTTTITGQLVDLNQLAPPYARRDGNS